MILTVLGKSDHPSQRHIRDVRCSEEQEKRTTMLIDIMY